MRSDGAASPGEEPDPAGRNEDPETLADRDQTLGDSDQTLSDSDQTLSDRDQKASDDDQAASEMDQEEGADSGSHARADAVRADTAQERLDVGHLREGSARERDRLAQARDDVAAQRDHEAELADRAALELVGGEGGGELQTLQLDELRAREAEVRARAALDRERAASDRRQAARDRELGARDREAARRERERAGTDELTGARRRGVGLEELEREIARARRTGESLVVAYVDVDGLKRVNDEHGHSAGDDLLRRMADRLRHHMRAYDLLVRLGGDEFLCVLSGVSLDEARKRFDALVSELPPFPAAGSISVGFGELRNGEGASALIDRADHSMLGARSR